jgi:hypothetical protein
MMSSHSSLSPFIIMLLMVAATNTVNGSDTKLALSDDIALSRFQHP